jgi:hypothetical protein
MQNRIDRLEGLVLSLMTNGAQSAGPVAAQAAIANSLSGSTLDSISYPNDGPESIQEDDEGEDSEVEQVAKSIGVMKMDNNKTIFASEAHWYAILGEVRFNGTPLFPLLMTSDLRSEELLFRA